MSGIVDLYAVAQKISRLHADMLQRGEEPTVASLLLESGRCPDCATPLLLVDGAGYCRICGATVDAC